MWIFLPARCEDPKYTGDIFTYSGRDVMDVFFNHLKEQE